MKSEIPPTVNSKSTFNLQTRSIQQRFGISAIACVLLLAAIAAGQARTLTVLHTFTGGADGANPMSELIRDSAGNLYGTTQNGGSTTFCGGIGCGTVFKIDSNGNESVLYSFMGGADGTAPLGGVIRDSAGNLYGTTTGGGASGFGTVFKLDKNGNKTILYSFIGPLFNDGESPVGSLVRDALGTLYGVTVAGGASGCVQGFDSSCGTVFKLDTTGKEAVLYSFQGKTDGAMPFAGVVMDGAGNLYGTAFNGGHEDPNSFCDVFGCGTVFKIDATGAFSVLYTFLGGKDGAEPRGPVALDAAGNVYGTTFRSPNSTGCAFGCGVIFKVNSAGKETLLRTFVGGNKAASPAQSKLLRGTGGVIWGTTPFGGASGEGVMYRVDPGGKETDLHIFTGGDDGARPVGGVVRDSAGNFYGQTAYGGDKSCSPGGGAGCGTVYKIAAVAP